MRRIGGTAVALLVIGASGTACRRSTAARPVADDAGVVAKRTEPDAAPRGTTCDGEVVLPTVPVRPDRVAWSEQRKLPPARVEEETTGKRHILAGDATLGACELFRPYSDAASGPFAGVASSAGWTATMFASSARSLLVVRDEAGVLRAARELGDVAPNDGAGVRTLDAFPGGHTIHAWWRTTGDGWDDFHEWLFAVDETGLRQLYTTKESTPMGSLERFAFVPGPPSSSPRIEVQFACRGGTVSEEDGGFRELPPRRSTKALRWDAATRTFK